LQPPCSRSSPPRPTTSTEPDALYNRLGPYDGLNVDTAEVSTGAVSRYLGLLAPAKEHFEGATVAAEITEVAAATAATSKSAAVCDDPHGG